MVKNNKLIFAISAVIAVISLGLVAAAIPFDLDDEDFGTYSHSLGELSGQINPDGSKTNVYYHGEVHDRDANDGVTVTSSITYSPGTSTVASGTPAYVDVKGYALGDLDSSVYLSVP